MRKRDVSTTLIALGVLAASAACGPASEPDVDLHISFASTGLDASKVRILLVAAHQEPRTCTGTNPIKPTPFRPGFVDAEVQLNAGEPKSGELKLEGIQSRNLVDDTQIKYAVMAVAGENRMTPVGWACLDNQVFEDGVRQTIELNLTDY